MLRALIFEEPLSVKIRLEGDFTAQAVPEVMQQWTGVREKLHERKAILDLGDLRSIDQSGKGVLKNLTRSGVNIGYAPPNLQNQLDELNCEDSQLSSFSVKWIGRTWLKAFLCWALPPSLRPCTCHSE